MYLFKRRPRVVVAALALAVMSGIAVPVSPAGAADFTNTCKNNASPNNSQINVSMTADAPAAVPPGASFGLTNIKQTLSVPAAVFVAGYNLSLLSVGPNTIPASAVTTIEGENTTQGTQITNSASGSISFTITDPDGSPSTGDEGATPGALPLSYADQAWTAGAGGTVSFREDTVTALNTGAPPSLKGGVTITAPINRPDGTPSGIVVRFACSPGTVTGSEPGVPAFIDPAASFASTAISATAPPPPPPPVPPPAALPAVTLTKLSISPSTFAGTTANTPVAAVAKGATVRWTLNRDATTTITFSKQTTRPPRPGPKPIRRLIRHGKAGANLLRFTARIAGSTLTPGTWKIIIIARDASGNTTVPQRRTFKIVTG